MICVNTGEHGKNLVDDFMNKGVIAFREPNILRAAPVPMYNSYEDVSICCDNGETLIHGKFLMIRKTKKITINGAGLIALFGYFITSKGFDIEVIEKRSDIRKITAEAKEI